MESLIERVSDSARKGVFGPGQLLRVETNNDAGMGAQFASQIQFFRVVLADEQSINNVPIVVKIQIDNAGREQMDTGTQFFNEVTMYKTILPKLCADSSSYPKMFMGEASGGEDFAKDILVLEDLRERGYKVADQLFLDFDHMTLAMRKLGEFHGSSYKQKIENAEIMQIWKKTLRLANRQENDDDKGFSDTCLTRGFRRCLVANGQNSLCRTAYDKLISLSIDERTKIFQTPEEPFASIIHGDYNKNNILFKYDRLGKVEKILLFDFATSIYSDPSIDLSFILYMNTSAADRDLYWEKYLSIYWAGVTSVCPNPGFSFDQFLDNFSKKAIYGYLPCSFFLPMMMFKSELTPEAYSIWTEEQKIEYAANHGGQEATDAISKIVEHLFKKGYLEQFTKLNVTSK